jgi:hypothetical protein
LKYIGDSVFSRSAGHAVLQDATRRNRTTDQRFQNAQISPQIERFRQRKSDGVLDVRDHIRAAGRSQDVKGMRSTLYDAAVAESFRNRLRQSNYLGARA